MAELRSTITKVPILHLLGSHRLEDFTNLRSTSFTCHRTTLFVSILSLGLVIYYNNEELRVMKTKRDCWRSSTSQSGQHLTPTVEVSVIFVLLSSYFSLSLSLEVVTTSSPLVNSCDDLASCKDLFSASIPYPQSERVARWDIDLPARCWSGRFTRTILYHRRYWDTNWFVTGTHASSDCKFSTRIHVLSCICHCCRLNAGLIISQLRLNIQSISEVFELWVSFDFETQILKGPEHYVSNKKGVGILLSF